ncbi:MAG: phenylacetate--CoA ligase, partial [Clostridia bacterium]
MTKYYNQKIECMTKEEKFTLQSNKLVSVVKRVFQNVGWYREKMLKMGVYPEDIKTIDDIEKLPFTEKHDLRDNYPFGSFAVSKKQIVRVHASSGTTGKLTVVGYTKKDIEDWAECCARGLY